MPTTYKTLGQTTATAASATVVNNLITDPTLEALATSGAQTSIAGNQAVATTLGSTWKLTAESTTNSFRSGVSNFGAGNAKAAYAGTNSFWAEQIAAGTNKIGFLTGAATTSTGLDTDGTSSYPQSLLGETFAISPSTTYYYGAYLYAWSGTPTVELRIKWYGSTGIYISSSSTTATSLSTTAWTKSSSSATSPSTAAYATMAIWGNLGNGLEFGFDNAWFTADSTANTTFPTPTGSIGNAILTAPFNKRSDLAWSGTANSSTTITTYAGALTDLYTVPASTQTVVSTITATNLTTSATSCRVLVLPSGQTAAAKNFIVFDGTLPANSTEAYTLGITLAAGDKIQVASDTANVSFSAFGSEIA